MVVHYWYHNAPVLLLNIVNIYMHYENTICRLMRHLFGYICCLMRHLFGCMCCWWGTCLVACVADEALVWLHVLPDEALVWFWLHMLLMPFLVVDLLQGSHLLHTLHPVDQLRELLLRCNGPDAEEVKAFFRLHKVRQRSSCVKL